MAFPVSNKSTNERRPTLLKDFLTDPSISCSSRAFKSVPRKPYESTIKTHIHNHLLKSNPKLPKSAFRTIVNTVKSISLATVRKTPLLLPRTLSRKLSRRKEGAPATTTGWDGEIKIAVKIKDILRWKSFRDLVDEQPPQSDFFTSSPTTATVSTTCTTCTSNASSSWGDRDFTSEDFPSWSGNSLNDVVSCKSFSPAVGKGFWGSYEEVGPKVSNY